MTRRLRLDDRVYDTDTLSAEGRVLLERLAFVQDRLDELSNNAALLHKAKNAYIADLKLDLVKGRAGLNLGALLGDE
jgi:hypothetical protein